MLLAALRINSHLHLGCPLGQRIHQTIEAGQLVTMVINNEVELQCVLIDTNCCEY
jgi:hypothetical protein